MICSQAGLKHLDERLNSLYSDLQPQLTVRARGELKVQQRA